MLHLCDCRRRSTQLARARAIRGPVGVWRRWEPDLGYHCVLGIPAIKQAMAPHTPCMLVGNRADGCWISGVAIHESVGDFLFLSLRSVLTVEAS